MSENIDQATTTATATATAAAVAVGGSSGNKNEIKITAEGVARLTFNYLDEMLGDSSLEPGEVKSPIIAHSPAATVSDFSNLESGEIISPQPHQKRLTDAALVQHADTKLDINHDLNAKDVTHEKQEPPAASLESNPRKIKKSASQLDAEACEEKVRAILELDAAQRQVEAERRKDEKSTIPPEISSAAAERKRLEKEERKRLKRIKRKKEQQAARLSLLSDEDVQKCLTDEKFAESRLGQQTEDNESEGLYSSPNSTPERSIESFTAAIPVLGSPGQRFADLPPNNMSAYPGDAFMAFRPMNPFMRNMRADFSNVRGGFVPRGRGCMRGNMRFPGYRPQFFQTPRHHTPVQRQQTPNSSKRRHSPIRAPSSNIMWTNTKPTIPYAFNSFSEAMQKFENKTESKSEHKSESNSEHKSEHKTEHKSGQKSEHKTDRKSKRASSKESKGKKANKQDRIKKRRSTSRKTKHASKEKIELIRKSFEKPTSKLSKTHERKKRKSSKEKPSNKIVADSVVSTCAEPQKADKDNATAQKPAEVTAKLANDGFDMFADSPPKNQFEKEIDDLLQSARLATQRLDATNKELKMKKISSESTSVPVKVDKTPTECKTSLQKALETQKRIDKLLQEDDLQLEVLQATKEKLMKETKRHNQVAASKGNKSPKRNDTPENLKHKNPFKRSLSNDRFYDSTDAKRFSKSRKNEESSHSRKDRSRERERERDKERGRDRERERERDRKRSRQRSRTRSGGRRSRSAQRNQRDKERDKEKHSSKAKAVPTKTNNSRSKSRESFSNMKSKSPAMGQTAAPKLPEKANEPTKTKEKKDKDHIEHKKSNPIMRKLPVSFSASEFLFPEECEDSNDLTETKPISSQIAKSCANAAEHTSPSNEPTADKPTRKPLKVQAPNDPSPDTNDYIDNWEHEDADEDANITCTPSGTTQNTLDDKFESRFINPSPPIELVRAQVLESSRATVAAPIRTMSPPHTHMSEHADNAKDTVKKPKIEDEFHVSPISSKKVKHELFGMQEIYEQFMKSVSETDLQVKNLSAIAVEPIDAAVQIPVKQEVAPVPITQQESARKFGAELDTTAPEQPVCELPVPVVSSTSDATLATAALPTAAAAHSDSLAKEHNQLSHSNVIANVNEFDLAPIPPEALQCTLPSTVVPESLKSFDEREGDLTKKNNFSPPSPSAPISPVQSNDDESPQKAIASRDLKKLRNLKANLKRIRKMRLTLDSADDIEEELIKMEKLFIQEKNAILQKYAKNTTARETVAPTPAQPNNETGFMPASEAEAMPEPNKIFDTNREAIKLKISPMKLPKTSAIFKEDIVAESDEKSTTETDDKDFTEWLAKPGKEVAIVKPMMESKESRSDSDNHHHQRHHSNSRSPYRSTHHTSKQREKDRHRRSESRNRSKSRYHSRAATLSVSPPRRGRNAGSPAYRSRLSSRQLLRRSRSRTRSPSRPTSSKRQRELSPHSYRKRKSTQQGYGGGSFRRKRTLSRSRTRSPRSRRCYSRSPLPFKPPSPPMRRSMSPSETARDKSNARHSSASPHSPRLPRSPQSPISPRSPHSPRSPPSSPTSRMRSSSELQFYAGKNADIATSGYYYNDTTNRVDARLNYVMNSPQDGSNMVPYGGYANYGHYDGATGNPAFMPMNAQQPGADGKYYRNEYMPAVGPPADAQSALSLHQHTSHSHAHAHPHSHSHGHQQLYSNIPTISSSDTAVYYYNEFPAHSAHGNHRRHQSTSLLKELPKAPAMAVRKGNVLEIVPSNETVTQSGIPVKSTLKPDNDDAFTHGDEAAAHAPEDKKTKSIIKKSRSRVTVKRVKFEDGIRPNHDTDDEDGNDIEAKIYRRMHRLLKRRSLSSKNIPPPPPPPHLPSAELPQPICRRPPSPPTVYFFHWDSAVNSMYFSQTETPIPPRLFNPKLAPVGTNPSLSGATKSPLYGQPPYPTMRRDGKAVVANRAVRTERASTRAMTPPPFPGHSRRDSPSRSVYHGAEQRTIKPMTPVGAGGFVRQAGFPNTPMRPPQTPFARSGYNTQRSSPAATVSQPHAPNVPVRLHTPRLTSPIAHGAAFSEFTSKMHPAFPYPPPSAAAAAAAQAVGTAGSAAVPPMTPGAQHNYTYYHRATTPQLYAVPGAASGIGIGSGAASSAALSFGSSASVSSSGVAASMLLQSNASTSPSLATRPSARYPTNVMPARTSTITSRMTGDNPHYAGTALHPDRRTNLTEIELMASQQPMFSPFQI